MGTTSPARGPAPRSECCGERLGTLRPRPAPRPPYRLCAHRAADQPRLDSSARTTRLRVGRLSRARLPTVVAARTTCRWVAAASQPPPLHPLPASRVCLAPTGARWTREAGCPRGRHRERERGRRETVVYGMRAPHPSLPPPPPPPSPCPRSPISSLREIHSTPWTANVIRVSPGRPGPRVRAPGLPLFFVCVSLCFDNPLSSRL